MTRAITYYLAKDAVPLYTVERAGFKHMISKLNPRYELPSRKVFTSKEIPTLYTNVRSSVMAELKQIKYYAMTTDLWTSGACEPYITLTVHYIDVNGVLSQNVFCLKIIQARILLIVCLTSWLTGKLALPIVDQMSFQPFVNWGC